MARYLKRRWKRPAAVLAAGLGTLLLAGFGPFHARRGTSPSASATGYRVQGEVESLWSRGVGAAFDGRIAAMAVQEGQAVRKGDLLFRMDTAGVQSELGAARAEKPVAEASLKETRREARSDLSGLEKNVAGLERRLAAERARALAAVQQASGPDEAADVDTALAVDEDVQDDQAPDAQAADQPAPAVDSERIRAMEAQVAEARRPLEERRRSWAPNIRTAEARVAHAEHEIARFQNMLQNADRRSPIDGVVTALYTRAGLTVPGGRALMRLDNPAGYRIVTLVDQDVRDRVEPGTPVRVARRQGAWSGKLEKIVAGEDRQLFHYWLWVKPDATAGLMPGQKVDLEVSAQSAQSASL
jgi:multidrug resistance efflux pump